MTTTKQADNPMNLNPTGKGGFGDNPQNRSDGGWKKENTISYQYKRFLNMSPDELKAFANVPDNERTVAMDIAYSQVLASRKSLPHTKEITDRTEGRAKESHDITTNGQSLILRSLTREEIDERIRQYYDRNRDK
jgi:hypothetical protein